MRLGLRLKRVLDQIEDNPKCVFDVGADHGFLTLALINKKKCKSVVASDISASSLAKTQKLVEDKGIEDRVLCLISDGLDSYPKDLRADYVVVAGMGENEIIKILDKIKDFSLYKYFILQPMQDAVNLRKFLLLNNFEIIYDEIILDKNKFYSIIKVIKTNKKQTFKEDDLWFGLTDLKNLSDDFIDYVSFIKKGLDMRQDYLTEVELKKQIKCNEILKIKR